MGDVNITEIDLYELLGIDQTSTNKDIKTAYRKKALSCHPDKNPDDPNAAERFHTLSKALEVLIDISARAAYNKVLNAKKLAKARHSQLDAKRKKLKEDLEAKEQASMKGSTAVVELDLTMSKTDEDKLKDEIERLRKQGSRELKEEIERINKQVKEEWTNIKKNLRGNIHAAKVVEDVNLNVCRLRLQWDIETKNSLYNEENLSGIFKKYGPISAIVVSSKHKKKLRSKGSGIIEFENAASARAALQNEKGFPENPLRVEYLQPMKNTEEERSGVCDQPKGPAVRENAHFPSPAASFPSFNPTKSPLFPSIPVVTLV